LPIEIYIMSHLVLVNGSIHLGYLERYQQTTR
jgi:hypothetical protein